MPHLEKQMHPILRLTNKPGQVPLCVKVTACHRKANIMQLIQLSQELDRTQKKNSGEEKPSQDDLVALGRQGRASHGPSKMEKEQLARTRGAEKRKPTSVVLGSLH